MKKLVNINKMQIIGSKHKVDKVIHHKYHEIFPTYIERYYNSEGGIIEIGLGKGASLSMWLELFPNMHVYGLDRSPKPDSGDRHTIIQADQSAEKDLINVLPKINHPIYFINDDGSHIPEHQLLTFNILFPKLEVGGVYIIEDIETSYWTKKGLYGYHTRYGLEHPKSIVEIFKKVVDGVNYEFSQTYVPQVQHQEYFHSLVFARNCIIIVKKDPEIRTYRNRLRL